MLIKAQQKFLRTSPRKLRLVAGLIKRGSRPHDVLSFLPHVQKNAAKPLIKVIKQAIANATNNLSLSVDSLKIKEIQINQGPSYKRGQPVSRGQLHPILKRTSHITVILETEESKKVKNEKKEEGKEEKQD